MDRNEAMEYYMATVEQRVMEFVDMAHAGALSRDDIDYRLTAMVTAAFATGWDSGRLSVDSVKSYVCAKTGLTPDACACEEHASLD